MNRLLTVLALFGVGCGGSISIDDYYAQEVKIQCQFIVKCCAGQEGSTTYTSVDDCVTKTTASSALDDAKASIAAGTVKYNGSAASSCIDTERSLFSSCTNKITESAVQHVGNSCDEIIVGAKKLGDACDPSGSDSGCDDLEAYCASNGGATGTCTALTKVGGDCSESFCAQKSYCDQTTMKCAAQKSDNSACMQDFECSSGTCSNNVCAAFQPVAVTASCGNTTTN